MDSNALHAAGTMHLAQKLQTAEERRGETLEPVMKRAHISMQEQQLAYESKLFACWLSPLTRVYLDNSSQRAMRCVSKEISQRFNATMMIRDALRQIGAIPGEKRRAYVLSTGTPMTDQFEPWYFGVAFAFCFKYCVGMPDLPEFAQRPRHRRQSAAPRVPLELKVKLIGRRVESQLRRDWLLQFSTGNLLFRHAVNMAKTLYSSQKD